MRCSIRCDSRRRIQTFGKAWYQIAGVRLADALALGKLLYAIGEVGAQVGTQE